MSYKLLLADADGTLLDFEMSEKNAIAETFDSFCIPKTEEMIALYHEANRAQWERLERGETTQKQLRADRFADFIKLAGLHSDALEMSERFIYFLSRQSIMLSGAEDFCKTVSAVMPIVIVTNGISEVQRGRFKRSPLNKYISGLVISEEVGCSKPDARIAEEAMELAGCGDKRSAVLLGDSITADIRCALSAGIDSVLYTAGNEAPEGHGASYTAKDYAEALRIILKNIAA